jgi:hypothetical protein
MNEVDQIRSWVIPIDFFNHSAIVLQIDRQNDKPPSPIKFNPLWLEEEDFRNLVVQEGLDFIQILESRLAFSSSLL